MTGVVPGSRWMWWLHWRCGGSPVEGVKTSSNSCSSTIIRSVASTVQAAGVVRLVPAAHPRVFKIPEYRPERPKPMDVEDVG
jgi:hypothetical protein